MQQPDMRLDTQIVLVTGGGAGIGRAIALACAAVGADVVIAERIAERGEETAARVREMGCRALPVTVDVSDGEQVQALIAQTQSTFGRLDVLVNNAGGVAPKAFLDQSPRAWQRIIDLNLMSLLHTTAAAVPLMIAGGRGGAIINVASIEASRAAPGYAVYAACKAGMLNFTRTMALELAEHRIRVNAIAPDYTVTPGLRGNVSGPVDPATWIEPTATQNAASARRIPLGRTGIDHECGSVAVFLASAMSAYVTGTTLPVDGGTWASSGWIRDRSGRWTLSGEVLP